MLDQLDREIIATLENMGLRSSREIARVLGIGERTIRRRVNTMLADKIVSLVVSPNVIRLGYKAWARILMRVKPSYLNEVTHTLILNPAIYFLCLSSGQFDIIISTQFRDLDNLNHFVNWELTHIEGVTSVETMLLVSPRKYNLFRWPKSATLISTNETAGFCQHGDYLRYELDNIEVKILDELMQNGPERPRKLASQIGISESKIRNRLKSMWQNEVYKIEVLPTINVLEYETHATIGLINSQQYPDIIIDALVDNPCVHLASEAFGRFNIVLVTRFPNPDLFNDFVTKVLPSIPGINATETFLHLRRLKYRNMTWPFE